MEYVLKCALIAVLALGIGCSGNYVNGLKSDAATTIYQEDTGIALESVLETEIGSSLTIFPNHAVLSIGVSEFHLEIVSSQIDQERGLMGRTELEQSEGVLFVFEREERWPLWMKGTLIPLDAIWVGSSGIVEHIAVMHPQPEVDDAQLKIYAPQVPCLYAIEISSGSLVSTGIDVGLQIDIRFKH